MITQHTHTQHYAYGMRGLDSERIFIYVSGIPYARELGARHGTYIEVDMEVSLRLLSSDESRIQ